MHLPLTKFHMYLEIIILQDINTNTLKIHQGGTFRRSVKQTCAKNKWKGPSTQVIWAKDHPRSSPHPLSSPPREGGGERVRSRVSHPHLAPLSLFFIWRWHGSMQRRWRPGFRGKDSLNTALLPYINRGVELPSTTQQERKKRRRATLLL